MSLANYLIEDLNAKPEYMDAAALWFCGKWDVPKQAYLDSMKNALLSPSGVPRWYIVTNERDKIIAGLGVIENDFHKRPDLTPNLCALFVEEPCRRQGIARTLLDRACADLSKNGIVQTYLITSHTGLYERLGWIFWGMVEEYDGNYARMYQHITRD